MRLPTWTPLAATLLLGACSSPITTGARPDGVLAELADPDAVELLALHPYPHALGDDDADLPRFHGYGVLGRAPLADDEQENRVLALVERGIETSDGMVAACFDPRHGLRVTAGGATWDFVICYACLSMNVFRDDVQLEGHLTSDAVEPQMTALFESAGLTIHRDGD